MRGGTFASTWRRAHSVSVALASAHGSDRHNGLIGIAVGIYGRVLVRCWPRSELGAPASWGQNWFARLMPRRWSLPSFVCRWKWAEIRSELNILDTSNLPRWWLAMELRQPAQAAQTELGCGWAGLTWAGWPIQTQLGWAGLSWAELGWDGLGLVWPTLDF